MNAVLIINIKELLQAQENADLRKINPAIKKGKQAAVLDSIKNAFLYIEDGFIKNYGAMAELPIELKNLLSDAKLSDPHSLDRVEIVNASGRLVMPAFCDSHTHLVYAGSREREFVDKINGLSYKEIAARGGGILNSADLLHNSSEDVLYESAMARLNEIISQGTGAVEIKSGYGLSVEDEIKMLRVVRRIKESAPIDVKATFLGAHAYPRNYIDDKQGYVNEIINTMIPLIASEDLADYIDAFCEDGFFSYNDCDRIFNAGIKYGMAVKVHANQMGFTGGVQIGVKYNAVSVDHLESCGKEEIECLKNSTTIATMLPGATFFLNMNYAPARELINNNVPVALASNYNPGSCPSGSLQFQMALACIAMKITPTEAFNACTINGAYAMGLEDELGSITIGKKARVLITRQIPSLDFIPYAFTSNFIERVIL